MEEETTERAACNGEENPLPAATVAGNAVRAQIKKEKPLAASFQDPEELLRAYRALEEEVERRGRRLRELEGRLSSEQATAADGDLDARVGRAVERYLADKETPYLMSGGASFAAAPARRVRSLEEAGKLAQELFRK